MVLGVTGTLDSESHSEQMNLVRPSTTSRTEASAFGRLSRQRCRQLWACHFGVCLLALALGIRRNHGIKYIPISLTMAGDNCHKAFLNVMASSEAEPSAIVCCDSDGIHDLHPLCLSKGNWPLQRRLTRIPDAWIIPLFPWTVRWLVGTDSGHIPRGCLYFLVIAIRMYILYMALNGLEDVLLTPIDESCWYRSYLKDGSDQCYGRVFDFSDHVVLYYAQILPPALAEVTHALTSRRNAIWSTVLLGASVLYLYLVTLASAFKTACFFHTSFEIMAGFGVSLLVSLPLCWLQCQPSMWGSYFFDPNR